MRRARGTKEMAMMKVSKTNLDTPALYSATTKLRMEVHVIAPTFAKIPSPLG